MPHCGGLEKQSDKKDLGQLIIHRRVPEASEQKSDRLDPIAGTPKRKLVQ